MIGLILSIILFVLGIVVGIIISVEIVIRIYLKGNLIVNYSDPDGPYLFVELSKSVPNVCSRKYVLFKVKE